MTLKNINQSMSYLTHKYGKSGKNIAVNLAGLIEIVKDAKIDEAQKCCALNYIEDEIKYGLDLTDEQKGILLGEITKEEVKEEVRSFRI